jgi:hypothetical protein
VVVLWLELSHIVCRKGSKKDPIGGKIDPIFGGYSGHAVTVKDKGFVRLNPRNLSMVVDHNEIKPNFTN